MRWLLSQQQFANLISLGRVLSRHSAWVARLGRTLLAALEDGACRRERNRDGHCDANGRNDRDKYVMKGLHVDGHWSVLSLSRNALTVISRGARVRKSGGSTGTSLTEFRTQSKDEAPCLLHLTLRPFGPARCAGQR
jgi:hypothetical protein